MPEAADRRQKRLESRAMESKGAARKRLVERGTVQFRIDPEMMALLLEVAEYKRTPAGVLARMWVVERLRSEENTLRHFEHAQEATTRTKKSK